MRIATWNVNSINQRLSHLKDLISNENLDVVMLQEIKCEEKNFPWGDLEDLGLLSIVKGQKAYNGVAIVSKFPILSVSDRLIDDDARYQEATFEYGGNAFRLINVYVPNGQSPDSTRFIYKAEFCDALNQRIKKLLQMDEVLIVAGDFNAAPENIDVYDHKKLANSMGFHIVERSQLRSMLNVGLIDAFRIKYPDKKEFSWWDYRSLGFQYNRGMRIDHILVSPEGADIMKDCYILKEMRGLQKPSDHVPVIYEC